MTTKRERARHLRHNNDWEKVLSTPHGRRVVFDILSTCGVGRQPMTGNSHTFFHLGEMNIGLKIITELDRIDPRVYPKLLLEQAEEVARTGPGQDTVETEDESDDV